MVRSFASALVVLALLAGWSHAADKAVKNQMVKGTIKSVDANKALLIVNQKVKNEVVDRELDIQDNTEFVFVNGGEKHEAKVKAALLFLEGKEGSMVQVKCDKDVKPIKVTVTIKK
jgi:hypothetical protein